MKLKVQVVSLIVALLYAYSSPVLAGQTTLPPVGWDAIKSIPPSEKIEVKLKDGKTIKGRVLAASDSALTLSQKGVSIDVAKDSVKRVYRVMPRRAARSLAIGAGAGAGAGAALGLVIAANYQGDSGEEAGYILILGLVGAGIGSLIGGLTGALKPDLKALVYEAR